MKNDPIALGNLQQTHDHLIAEIAAQLNLEEGLAQIRADTQTAHDNLIAEITSRFNFGTGVAQIIQPQIPRVMSAQALEADLETALGSLASGLAVRPLRDRLNLRSRFPLQDLIAVRFVALMHDHAHRITRLVSKARASGEPDRTSHIDAARILIKEFLGLLQDPDIPYLEYVVNIASEAQGLLILLFQAYIEQESINRVRDQARTLDVNLAGRLAGLLDLARASALPRAHDQKCGLTHDAVCALPNVFARDRSRAQAHAVDTMLSGRFSRDLVTAIDLIHTSISDVTTSDLSQFDLDGMLLDGLQWSSRTQWPPKWENRIREISISIGPDLFEVRDGSTLGPEIVVAAK